jgi:hypothetical protein
LPWIDSWLWSINSWDLKSWFCISEPYQSIHRATNRLIYMPKTWFLTFQVWKHHFWKTKNTWHHSLTNFSFSKHISFIDKLKKNFKLKKFVLKLRKTKTENDNIKTPNGKV